MFCVTHNWCKHCLTGSVSILRYFSSLCWHSSLNKATEHTYTWRTHLDHFKSFGIDFRTSEVQETFWSLCIWTNPERFQMSQVSADQCRPWWPMRRCKLGICNWDQKWFLQMSVQTLQIMVRRAALLTPIILQQCDGEAMKRTNMLERAKQKDTPDE